MRRKLIYEPIQNRQNTEIAVVAVQRQLLHVFTRSLARANTRHCSSFRPYAWHNALCVRHNTRGMSSVRFIKKECHV